MIEILPIKSLRDEDALIFGPLNVKLAKLQHYKIPVAKGIVVTAPSLHLKTSLEHYDFGSKEIFEQSLILVKKEIQSIKIPEVLYDETDDYLTFLLNDQKVQSVNRLWSLLLDAWISQIKQRLWQDGFYSGITENLEPQVVIFIDKLTSFGTTHLDPLNQEVVLNIKQGQLNPKDAKYLDQLVTLANHKLIIPYSFDWIDDHGIKLTRVWPFTHGSAAPGTVFHSEDIVKSSSNFVQKPKSTVKIYLDFSVGFTVERNIDGVFIASEKIFDLNKPHDSFEELTFKLVESANTYENLPIFLKLADKSEGMGKVRGALRLIHQDSLFEPIADSVVFARRLPETKC